jgi:hypothetical protein
METFSTLFEKLRPIVPNGRKHWQGNSARALHTLARCCAEATKTRAARKPASIGARSAKMMIGKGKAAGCPRGAASARETRVFPP